MTFMDHEAWTVDTTASTACIATSGTTSEASSLTAMGASLAVVGIVTGHDTNSASGVFSLAPHPGAAARLAPAAAAAHLPHLSLEHPRDLRSPVARGRSHVQLSLGGAHPRAASRHHR